MLELRALVDAYALAVDERDGHALRALFAPDGVLAVVGPDGAESHRYLGDEITTVPERLVQYDLTLHLVSTHRCRVDGDRAGGVAYCEAHHRTGRDDRVRYLRYDDEYVRLDATWRFRARRVTTVWMDER